MYKIYSQKAIYLYYTKNDIPFLKWSKSFWILKSPHPVHLIEVMSLDPCTKDPLLWLKKTLNKEELDEGLYAPVRIKPVLEIDLIEDSSQMNRFGYTKQKFPVICLINKSQPLELNVDISHVFDDLTSQEFDDHIKAEIAFMKNTLLMGI
jgi:hypothetical protein